MRDIAQPIPLGLNFMAPQAECKAALDLPAYPEFDMVKSEVRPLGQLRDSFIVATDSIRSHRHRPACSPRARSF